MATTSYKAAVIGLGSMGGGMASSLLAAGIPTWGFDVTAEREAAFRGEGGLAGSRQDAAGRRTPLSLPW